MPVEVIKTIKYDELRKLKDVQIPERPDMAVYQRVDNLRRYIGRFNVNYSRNWQIFKHHYIPVVDHIFIDPNGYQVYVPDLTENGSILLGKAVKERIDRGLAISSNHLEIFKTTIEKTYQKYLIKL